MFHLFIWYINPHNRNKEKRKDPTCFKECTTHILVICNEMERLGACDQTRS
jgi:hypothetical protein